MAGNLFPRRHARRSCAIFFFKAQRQPSSLGHCMVCSENQCANGQRSGLSLSPAWI
jgi:hypothetical protein